MKRFFALLLCAFLCVQSVAAADTREFILYEENTDTQTQNTDSSENTDTPDSDAGPNTAGDTNADTPSGASEGIDVSAPSAILMEASTGQIIFDKAADEQRPPASVTKVMTLLLIFDALKDGKIKLDDPVTTSDFAASMGGSQVFLEPGESQTVDTMIKCITVASANDACVAMAEHIWGNEEEFVKHMNERAKGLGMNNTHFVNCNGLDTDGHLTTARDIALMSRELITTYPQIRDYTMIWMENITHTTQKGTSEFGLTNTNKLVRQYQYTTGLKTGSTDKAKFCISATAEKDGMELIAVIMAAPDAKARVKDATTLLNYGFGKCNKFEEKKPAAIDPVPVTKGVEDHVKVKQAELFAYIDTTGADLNSIDKKITLKKSLKAPVEKGDKAGVIKYSLNGQEIGHIDIIADADVEKASYKSSLRDTLEDLLL